MILSVTIVDLMAKRGAPFHADQYPVPFGFGHVAGVYRWFSGRPLNGHRYTDATAFHYGTASLDPSGRASSYHLLPGYRRFLYFRVPAMLAIPYVFVAMANPGVATMLAVGLATLATWRLDGYRRLRRFRGHVVEPVARGVSSVLRVGHVAGKGHEWVHVPRDFRDDPAATIRIALPMSWVAEDGDQARLVREVSRRLQVDDLAPTWSLYSPTPSVQLHVPPKPPGEVRPAELPELDVQEDTGDIVVGMGASHPESFSLNLESPHMLIAGGTGAGKSESLAAMVGQFMRRGYGVAVLDAKFTSHMWLRRVPGVLYASESQELHDALIWLDGEMIRRARFVSSGGDPETLIPLVVVLEEMTGASNRLRSYWSSIKEQGAPQMSPALTALVNLSSMGRELRIHILMAGQSLTAKAVGGPENRENFGARALARATAAQWKMLAPQIKPAPVKRGRPGRWHLVVGDMLREFQAPFMDLKNREAEIIEWATGGHPIPDVVAMMAGAAATTVGTNNPRSEAVAAPEGMGLRRYAAERGVSYQSLIDWRTRRPDFPVEVGEGANRTKLYDPGHLDAFVAGRLREPATADEGD